MQTIVDIFQFILVKRPKAIKKDSVLTIRIAELSRPLVYFSFEKSQKFKIRIVKTDFSVPTAKIKFYTYCVYGKKSNSFWKIFRTVRAITLDR